MNHNPRCALVTGAAGTVGSAVVRRLLDQGIAVRGLVRSDRGLAGAGPNIVRGNLLDAEAVARACQGQDLVVHCAAELSSDPRPCRRTNIEGTRNVVEAALAAGCRMVHVSTVSVYDHRVGLRVTEDSPLWTEEIDAYGHSKAEAERVVRAAGSRGLEAVILRPVIVLSTHPTSYWGPLALARARAEDTCVYPARELPYVDVDNFAEAILLAARTPAATGRAYNVVDGHADAREYLAAVYQTIGRPVPALPPDAPEFHCSGDRIRADLGYDPPDRWQPFLAKLRAAG